MLASSFLFLSLLVTPAFADNDWSKPCFSGACQYDLPASNTSASGTVMIWGSDKAISDITPAAGWEIIGCSPDALKQDIRLVCKDGSSVDCAHLYDGTTNTASAVGKVVRLPENCGKSAFAVVTKSYVPQDQSIPANVASSLTRRDGTKPAVRGLSLDTNFASAATPPSGPVNFALRAANVPGANGDLSNVPQQQRRSNSRFMRRGISSFVSSAVDDISSLNDFNVDKSKTLSPVDVDKTFNLLDKQISCPPVSAGLKIDAETKAHAVASIGIAAAGTILPPKVTSFSLIAGLNANLDGSIDMTATASGSLDSGKIKLFEVGIPGLDFPGILSIGPSFEVNGQATANLDLDVDMTIGVSYTISNAQLVFPPGSQKSTGTFNIGDTPLKISAGATGKATGTVVAHLIPTLNFGISALDNTVSANVFLDLDASATMTLTAEGSANAAGTVTPRDSPASEVRRGVHLLSPPSLNRRSPQIDDSDDQGDDTEDDSGVGDDSEDAGLDGSNNNSEDNSSDNSDSDSQDDSANVDDNTDNSTDADTGDSSTDAGTNDPTNDNTGDSSDFDNGSSDADQGNSASDDSATSDDGTDGTVDDTTTDGNDSTDAGDNTDAANADNTDAANADNTDAANADNSETSDPSTDDSSNTADAVDTTDNADPADNTDNTNNTDNTDASATPTATSDDAAATATDADTGAAPTATSEASKAKVALTDASASFGGCFEVVGGLDVNAGADGSFFGLFDKSTQVSLFSKKFEILKKCFGSNAGATRRDSTNALFLRSASPSRFFSPSRPTGLSIFKRAGLTCTAGGEAKEQSIVDETVPASQISQK